MTERQHPIKQYAEPILISDSEPASSDLVSRYIADRNKIAEELVQKGRLEKDFLLNESALSREQKY